MITILLADDHPVVRDGARAILECVEDFQIVGETSDGLEAVRLTTQLEPDILITDIMMPGLSGLQVTRQVTQSGLKTRVIVMSIQDELQFVMEALRNGASGYLLKDAPTKEIFTAVREVAAGRRYLSKALTDKTLDSYVNMGDEIVKDPFDLLSEIELSVLKQAAAGLNSLEISQTLSTSVRNVEIHRSVLMRKLGLQNQNDLIRYALKKGLIQ